MKFTLKYFYKKLLPQQPLQDLIHIKPVFRLTAGLDENVVRINKGQTTEESLRR